jgi:hypothetical protein
VSVGFFREIRNDKQVVLPKHAYRFWNSVVDLFHNKP